MKKDNKILLLKLGGSLLTDKNKPLSIRKEIVKSTIQQIIKADQKIILIHGGGSFGHPFAKKYNISSGFDPSVPNQIYGLVRTHQAMVDLNSYLVEIFLELNYPVLSIQPSSVFLKDGQRILFKSIDTIETLLDLNILPVLYGDIILDKNNSFSIISGDQIIFKLCKELKKYQIYKVIFAIETDGIYINDQDENPKLATEIFADELDNLNLADLGKKIDVTGGIKGKINSIKKVCNINIPVQLINGLKENYIYKSLKNEKLICTDIKIKK